ncbi:hypothetical protein ACHAWF_008321 [Thalassiosira exigua]
MCTLKEASKALRASTEREAEALRDDVESLQSENKALKWSLDRLASKVQEGWEYPVAIQPDEYWQNKGYGEDDIDGLHVGFLEEMKEAVSQLEHGVFESVLISHVDHDEDLMPHWNALFRSFEHINPHGAGVELDLRSIELNEVMRQICHHIRLRNINGVYFFDNGFVNMRDAIGELGKALKSTKLKSLNWSGNPIQSVEDMTLFTRILSQSSALDELYFSRNTNENAQALLSGVDFSTYKVLNLWGNNLQPNGRTDIPGRRTGTTAGSSGPCPPHRTSRRRRSETRTGGTRRRRRTGARTGGRTRGTAVRLHEEEGAVRPRRVAREGLQRDPIGRRPRRVVEVARPVRGELDGDRLVDAGVVVVEPRDFEPPPSVYVDARRVRCFSFGLWPPSRRRSCRPRRPPR